MALNEEDQSQYNSGDGDPPDWTPPDYAKPVEASQDDSGGGWKPPDYAKPVSSKKKEEPGMLSKFVDAVVHPKPFKPSGAGADTLNKVIDSVKNVWNKASEPLTEAPTRFAEKVSKFVNPNSETTGVRGIGSAYIEGLGHAVSGLSSPLNLGMAAVSGGASAAGEAGFGEAASALHNVNRGLSVPVAAEGAKHTYEAVKEGDKAKFLSGVLEAGMGVLGLRDMPEAKGERPPVIEPQSARRAPPRKLLGPAKFIGGEGGIAEPGREYTRDTSDPYAVQHPEGGTLAPGDLGEVNKVPPEIAAEYGLGPKSARQAEESPAPESAVKQPVIDSTRAAVTKYMQNNPDAKTTDIKRFIDSVQSTEKPSPTRSPNLDPERFNIGTKEQPKPAGKSADDILYDIARNKQNMGKDMSDTKAEFLGLNEEKQPMYNIVNEDGTRSTFTGSNELVKRGIAVPETPKDAVPMKGSEIRDKMLADKAAAEPKKEEFVNPFAKAEANEWKPPEYAKPAGRDYTEERTNLRAEYEDYKKTEIKAGRKPIKFNEYENRQPAISEAEDVAGERFKGESSPSAGSDEPQAMKVKGVKGDSGLENIAMGPKGIPPRLMDMMGNSLYTRDRPAIVNKENLVNSIDEHRITGQKKPIYVMNDRVAKIPGTNGEEGSSVTTRDQGRGLTPKDLYTLYTDIGTTGKQTEESASGGFGIAKAAPFLAGRYAQVESIVKEGGQKVKYSFEGTPVELKNQNKGVQIKREVVDPKAPTGLLTRTYFDKKTSTSHLKEHTQRIAENSPDNASPIHYMENFMTGAPEKFFNHMNEGGLENPNAKTPYEVDYLKTNENVHNAKPAKPIQDTIDLPEAKINIHYEDKPTTTADKYRLHLLNKGIYQDTKSEYYPNAMDNVPKDITADIISKVEEGHGDYPFGMNRQDVSDNVSQAIHKWVEDNVVSGAQKKKADRLKAMYSALSDMDVKGTIRKSMMFDAGDRLTSLEKAQFKMSPVVQNVTRHFDDMLNRIVNLVDTSRGSTARGDKLEATGLLLSEPHIYGIHIPKPGAADKSTIGINWLSPMENKSPEDAALFSTVTAMHEAAHISPESGKGFSLQDVRDSNDPRIGKYLKAYFDELDSQGGLNAGHAMDFIKRLGEVFTQFGPKETFDAADRLHGLITDKQTGGYSPAVQKLLQIYQDSRGRPETTEDLLSTTGIRSETPKGGKRSAFGSDQPNGEGATTKPDTSQAIGKLFSALEEAKTGEAEQASIYKKERARRFAAFGSVGEGGAAGAAKSLGKLSGSYEKVNPGERLSLNQEDTDSLFTAIKFAGITEPEKARAYTGLFKLLNGEAVPQRNELRIMDDVFGSGFADKVIEMHGGLGAVGLNVAKAANTMKSMQNSLSLAAPLRHGIGLIHRAEFRPAFKDMFKFFANKDYYDQGMQAIVDGKDYMLKREAGLFTAKPGSLLGSEEEFLNSYAGSIPGVKQIVGASQRGYVGFLNKLRDDTSQTMLETARKAGIKTEDVVTDDKGNVTKTPTDATKAIMRFVNVFSGRGELPFGLEKMTNELNVALWSPRMMASRIQMFTNPKIYTNLPKGQRLEGLKSALAIASLGTVIDTALAYGGAKVSYNILSTDYGKARMGTKLVDPWGGLQQYVVGFARFLTGKTDTPQPTNRLEIGGRFLANKESPVASLAHNLLTSKFTGKSNDPLTAGNMTTQYGEKTSVQSQVAKQFIPIFVQDINDLIKSDPKFADNIGLNTVMGVASLAGMSQSYPERKPGGFKFRSQQRLRP